MVTQRPLRDSCRHLLVYDNLRAIGSNAGSEISAIATVQVVDLQRFFRLGTVVPPSPPMNTKPLLQQKQQGLFAFLTGRGLCKGTLLVWQTQRAAAVCAPVNLCDEFF